MPSLWFIVPVHGRIPLAAICLKQLQRTCNLLTNAGIDATAVIIADHQNLVSLWRQLGRTRLGFATVTRDNNSTSRRFNDGIQLATDPRYNGRPADYIVPCGSDDWVDHRLFLNLPAPNTIIGFQRFSVVREDGLTMASVRVNYEGGVGIRIIPRELVADVGYRPADEDRKRGCDTSILTNLRRFGKHEPLVEHRHLHDYQIIDWKTPIVQLNTFEAVTRIHSGTDTTDPFDALADVYPSEALTEMAAYYQRIRQSHGKAAA